MASGSASPRSYRVTATCARSSQRWALEVTAPIATEDFWTLWCCLEGGDGGRGERVRASARPDGRRHLRGEQGGHCAHRRARRRRESKSRLTGALLASATGNLLQNAFKFSHGERERHAQDARDEGASSSSTSRTSFGGLAGRWRRGALPALRAAGARIVPASGLGLAIVRRGVEANGGEIHARDMPGKGCVFTIDLPRASHPLSRGKARRATGGALPSGSRLPPGGTSKARATCLVAITSELSRKRSGIEPA